MNLLDDHLGLLKYQRGLGQVGPVTEQQGDTRLGHADFNFKWDTGLPAHCEA